MPASIRRTRVWMWVLPLSVLHAQDEALGAKDMIRALVDSNPEIRAARARFEASTKRPSQAGAMPDPKLSYTNLGVGHPWSRLNGSDFAYQGIGLSQELPFPGKLGLASEEAKRESEAEQQNYIAVVRDVSSRLKVAYLEWLAAQRAIEVTRKKGDLLSRFEEIARNRYAVGRALQADVLKAQLEVATRDQEIAMLEEQGLRAEAEIASLLARPSVRLASPREIQPSALAESLDDLLKAAADSPRIRLEQRMVDARAVGITRSQKDFRPDLGVNFQWQHTGGNFPDYYMAAVEVKIPIHYSRKQRFALEEAYARMDEAKQNYRSAQQQAIFQVKEQYLAAQRSERVMNLYKTTLLPQASLTVDSSTAAYETGAGDFLSLITNLTAMTDLQRQYSDEVIRHEQALARLEPLVGKELVSFEEVAK